MKIVWIGLAAVATVGCTFGNALADGLPQRVYQGRDCASFHGFYVGANAGSAQLTAHQNNLDGYRSAAPAGFTSTDNGFAGGMQAGYNMQRHCTVFGVEADWNWAGLKAETDPFANGDMTTGISTFGTLRTRSGIVVDSTLLYLTGGLAWADVKSNLDFVQSAPAVNEHFSWSDTRLGWTAGVGVEYALTNSISIKSETLYMNFGETSHNVSPTPGCGTANATCRFKDAEDAWVARIGINYRFGGRDEVPLK